MKIPYLYISAVLLFLAMGLNLLSPETGRAQSGMPEMVLDRAVICEAMENYQPVNPAVIFSMARGEVFCFSEFNPVRVKTHIFHKWYKQDKLIFTMRLVLSPPKWSSFSRIQLRDADKGPWRVEIQDKAGHILETLRFSISD
ncbi:MAG: DUF2914 domain-containing protein [Desulfobacter sp.]|nr:MAG: DUF2914 domain-containing protein [Desulfobacter sp.]